jgi:uncharacterized membrane protein YcaP (DUF421 family)
MEILVRATIVYWLLWLIVRGIGKRSLGEISPLELILVVVMGDIVQQGVTQEDMSVTGAAIAVLTMTAWALSGDALARRNKRAAGIIDGVPVVLLLDGEPLEGSLAAESLSLDDLKEAAREKGIADLRQVSVAVLNPDGRIAFIEES